MASAPPLPMTAMTNVSNDVLVADGDPRAAAEVRGALEDMGLRASIAFTVAEAVAMATARRPRLLVAEVDIGGEGFGLHLAETFRTRWGTPVVFVGGRLEARALSAIAASDPRGFVCKPLARRQLETTLRLALARDAMERRSPIRHEPPEGHARHGALEDALRRIATVVSEAGVSAPAGGDARTEELLRGLRPREREIVSLLLEHERVPAIALRLGISPATVRNHLKRVFKQTGAHSQQELLARLHRAR